MRYEINVAIGGQHYCRITLPESYSQEVAAKHKAREIAKLFGSAFEITLTRWEETGRTVKLGDE